MAKPKKDIKYCKTPEVDIEYLLTGKENDEDILFVHGLGSNLRQFFPQQNHFSKDFEVLSVSLRGHADSSKPQKNVPAEYSIKKFVDDLKYLLHDKGIDGFHYVGNSMGGIIGYEFIKQNPGRVKSLTTFGTTAELDRSLISQKLKIFLTKIVYKLYGKNGYGEYVAGKSTTYPTTQRIMSYIFTLTDLDTLVNTQKNLGKYSYLNTLKNTDIPVLLIKCGRDRENNKNLESTLDIFNRRDDLEIKEMKRAGHFANLERSNEFNEILEEHITKCSD